jgi:hypothetical protein
VWSTHHAWLDDGLGAYLTGRVVTEAFPADSSDGCISAVSWQAYADLRQAWPDFGWLIASRPPGIR